MGPWWPAPSAALRAAAQHWATWAMQKQELARNLISQHDLLLRNQGRTAEDLIGRYLRGAKSEVTKAEKYEIKKGACRRWYPLTACLPLAPDHTNPDTPRRMRYVTGDHAVQVFQLTSTVIDLTTKRKHTTVVYAATSMSGTPPLHR